LFGSSRNSPTDFSLILLFFLFWEFEGSSPRSWNANTLKLFFPKGLSNHPNFKPFIVFGRISWVGPRFFLVKRTVSPYIASSKLSSCSVCCITSIYKTLVCTIGIMNGWQKFQSPLMVSRLHLF
jgi:hypothetical protein